MERSHCILMELRCFCTILVFTDPSLPFAYITLCVRIRSYDKHGTSLLCWLPSFATKNQFATWSTDIAASVLQWIGHFGWRSPSSFFFLSFFFQNDFKHHVLGDSAQLRTKLKQSVYLMHAFVENLHFFKKNLRSVHLSPAFFGFEKFCQDK